MTIDQITTAVAAAKPVSRRQVIRYLNDCGLKPIGARQRPQRYPENSARLILEWLGLAGEYKGDPTRPANGSNGHSGRVSGARIPSLAQLRNERRKAKVGK